jgi:photosystem II stability/assembly factor-like uncharacterized protein
MKTSKLKQAFKVTMLACLATVSTRADALDTWSLVHSETNSALACVAFGAHGFVAAGADDAGALILRSDDGTQWSRVPALTSALKWQAIAYGQGVYILVGMHGAILQSTNGAAWAEVRPAGQDSLQAATFGNGLFVAGGSRADSGSEILTSSDGVTWLPGSASLSEGYEFCPPRIRFIGRGGAVSWI